MSSAHVAGRRSAAVPNLVRFVVFLLTAMSIAAEAAAPGIPGPSVTDVVEFTRLVAPMSSDEAQLRRQVSPDGSQAFIVTRKANTRTDRNRYEIMLLDLRPQRLEQGQYAPPVVVATLEPEVDDFAGYSSVGDLRWAGNRTILFRGRLRDALYQVFAVDTVTRALTQLTFSATDVVNYEVTENLQVVLYRARVHNPPLKDGRRSVVVGNQSFRSVTHGQDIVAAQVKKFQYYVAEKGSARHPRALGEVVDDYTPFPIMSLSPDGQWALLPHSEPLRQAAWTRDYPLVARVSKKYGFSQSIDPLGYFSRPESYAPMRLLAYRVADGSTQAVLDAPEGGTPKDLPRLLWQSDSQSVVFAGTHIPIEGEGQQRATAAHIVEYWPSTGRWEVISAVQDRVLDAWRVSQDAFVAVDEAGKRLFQRTAGGGWQAVEATSLSPESVGGEPSGWSLRIRQSLNTPPDIVAEGPAGRTVPLTRLNPQVSAAWGTMSTYDWTDVRGRAWKGGLLVPQGYQRGARRGLVIQTYGFTPHNFYLDGSNFSEVLTSAFAGRAFLQADLLVLAFPTGPSTGAAPDSRGRLVAFTEGVRAAIDKLVGEGVVDRDRVGIIGWSATGERVLNQITFTDTPIRAATIADGDANTQYSVAVHYGLNDGITDRKSSFNGGFAAGDTLANWVRNDPSLHTNCITTALRIEKYGPMVANNWDVYAWMRRQYKAVEKVVIPHGTHALMTPSERMVSLQGNVDWFRFWLADGERQEPFLMGESDETLREQYRQWREMAELKAIDDAKPMCARKAEGL